MTTYRLDIIGPHSDDYTRHVADALDETMRVLNHATIMAADTSDPATIHHVLGRAHTAVARMGQLLGQLDRRLAGMHESGLVGDDSGDLELALRIARPTLDASREAARMLADRLSQAHRATSGLYLREEGDQ